MMKKSLLLTVLILAAALLAVTCVVGKVEVYSDPSQTIKAGIDQEFTIALDSNPTTGYSWQESHDDTVLKMVEQKYEQGGQSKQGLVGTGGVDSFRFKALKSGKTQITMTYKRPWEQESAKQLTFTVEIK